MHRGGVGVEAEWRCCRRPAPHCLCQAHHSLHRMRPQGGPTTLLQTRAETVKRGVAVEKTRSCLLSPADPTQTYCHTPSPHPKLSQHPLQGSPDKPPQSWFSSNQSQEPWNPPGNPIPLCTRERGQDPFPCTVWPTHQPEALELPALSGESRPPPSSNTIPRTAAQSHAQPPSAPASMHDNAHHRNHRGWPGVA